MLMQARLPHSGHGSSVTLRKAFRGDCLWVRESLVRRFPQPRGVGEARWRSGYAEDCKSLHAGSIPARASTSRFRERAALAQLVEHIIRNDGVTGSSPVSGTIAPPNVGRRPSGKTCSG